MVTVVADGNYLFHKTFGIFSGFGAKSPGDVLSSESDRNLFMRKVITDLCYSLNQIPDINRVIFCKDSRSWRKDFKISRSVYKESRIKSEGVDWGSFFKLMDEFGIFLESNGYTYSRYTGAEGDDLIWAWCDHLKDSEDCVIVISGDKDMHQLVNYTDQRWTGIWNTNSKNNKISVSHDWKLNPDLEPTIFDVNPSSGSSDYKLDKLITSCVIDKINTKELVFKKILTGDKKDDVPGVFPFLKGGKVYNVSDSKAQKIWDLYLQSSWVKKDMEEIWDDQEFLSWLSGLCLRMLSQTDNTENREKFKLYYEENAKLVWLNSKTIPSDIIDGISEHIEKENSKERSNPVINKKQLIDKSPWGGTNNTPSGFDPFELFQ